MTAVPLLLDLTDRAVVCVGAGPVASAKVLPLVEAGADVTVIAPDAEERLVAEVLWEARPYRRGDLDRDPPVMLVVAATGVSHVDRAVAREARDRGIWCLRAEGQGDVVMPSVVRRGGLLLAAATGAPALTRRVRMRLEEVFDDRWGDTATLLARLRDDQRVRRALGVVARDERRRRWRTVVERCLDGGDGPLDERQARHLLEHGG